MQDKAFQSMVQMFHPLTKRLTRSEISLKFSTDSWHAETSESPICLCLKQVCLAMSVYCASCILTKHHLDLSCNAAP